MRRLRGRRAEPIAEAAAAARARREAFPDPLLVATAADRGTPADLPADLPADPPAGPARSDRPAPRRDPLADPHHVWQNEPAPCADLLAAELGIDPETGAPLAPGVAALLQGATASQWCETLDRQHAARSSYAAHA